METPSPPASVHFPFDSEKNPEADVDLHRQLKRPRSQIRQYHRPNIRSPHLFSFDTNSSHFPDSAWLARRIVEVFSAPSVCPRFTRVSLCRNDRYTTEIMNEASIHELVYDPHKTTPNKFNLICLWKDEDEEDLYNQTDLVNAMLEKRKAYLNYDVKCYANAWHDIRLLVTNPDGTTIWRHLNEVLPSRVRELDPFAVQAWLVTPTGWNAPKAKPVRSKRRSKKRKVK